MEKGYKNLRDNINSYPLNILSMSFKLKKVANTYFTKSVGIEIECRKKEFESEEDYIKQVKEFNNLGLIDMRFSRDEQNFRLNNGIEGMIQLYKLCELMDKYFLFNENSGIHYHIDMTSCFEQLRRQPVSSKIYNGTLKSLESWGYVGNYNRKEIRYDYKGGWVNIRPDFQTIEFRIGEMSFDYELIIKRILHLQSICKKIEKSLLDLK